MAEKKNNVSKRLDSNRIKLREGESQRKNGTYDYRWTTPDGKHHTIYATTLDELREKEEEIISDKRDGINIITDSRSLVIGKISSFYRRKIGTK